MRELISFEYRKIGQRPLVWLVLVIVLALNTLVVFTGTFGWEPTLGLPYSKAKVEQLRQDRGCFAGAIDEDWIANIERTYDELHRAMLDNPANYVSPEERARIEEQLRAVGYSDEAINSPEMAFMFIREEVLGSRERLRLEDPLVASRFYEFAARFGSDAVNSYREAYPGRKGEALAGKAEAMYDYLSHEYQAYYDYNWGWSRLAALQTWLPATLGLFLVVALSPIFAVEYGNRTDALLLTAKHGKTKLVKAKLLVASLVALCSWLALKLYNTILVLSLFGSEGTASFVQNWAQNPSPFAFTHLSSYFYTAALSLVGLLFLSATILFVSSRCRRPYVALFLNLLFILPAMINIEEFANPWVKEMLMFLPANILVAGHHFKRFSAYYLFGRAVLLPSLAAGLALTGAILLTWGARKSFSRCRGA